MPENVVQIKTQEEFINFLEKIDNFEFITKNKFDFKVPNVAIKLEGDNFKSSLTGSIIAGLHKYQEAIYKGYRQTKYGVHSRKKLSAEEVAGLEIKVTISEGSTDMILSFIKELTGLPNMTEGGIIAIASIAAGAWLLKNIAVSAVKSVFKTAQKNIQAKIDASKNDKEKTYYEQTQRSLQIALSGVADICHELTRAQTDKIKIDNKEVSVQTLESFVNDATVPDTEDKNIEKQYFVAGLFKVLNLNYEEPVTRMNALHVESGKIYNNISLQNDWIKEADYKTVKEAENREPIYFKILVHEKGKSQSCAIDVESIKDSPDK